MTQPVRVLCFSVLAATLLSPWRTDAQTSYASIPSSSSVVMVNGASVAGTIAIQPVAPSGPASVPRFMAITPDAKFLYVVDSQAGAVYVIDAVVNPNVVVNTISVGGCPDEVAFSPDGMKAYISQPCTIGMTILDVATQSLTNVSFGSGQGPLQSGGGAAVSPNGSKVYIGTRIGLGVYDTTTSTATLANITFAGGNFGKGGPCDVSEVAITPDGSQLIVTACLDAYAVDTSSFISTLLGATRPFSVFCDPGGVVISPNGARAFVPDLECDGGLVIDVSSHTATKTFGISGALYLGITSNGALGYASQGGNGTNFVQEFDATTGSFRFNIPVAGLPVGIAVLPDNNTALGSSIVTPLDKASNTSPVTVKFSNVTQAGYTSLAISSNGPPAPTGFSFGTPPVYYYISTTATFSSSSSSAIVCITAPAPIPVGSTLLHYSGTPPTPTDVTDPTSSTTTMICSKPLTSLSPFVISQQTNSGATPTTASISLSPAASITYGTRATATVTVGPASGSGALAGNVTLSFDGAAPITMALSSGSASFNLGILGAGNHSLSANFAAQGNFQASAANATLVVAQAPLTLTADNKSKVYGAALPNLTFTPSGFVNGDTVAGLPTQPTLGAAATAASGVGNYTITISGAVAPNYAITYANGTLTVTPATLTITASDATKILNAPNPASFGWSATGFMNGENASVLTANPTCTTSAMTASAVGSYPIICSGARAANYTFSYVAGTLKIQYATAIGHVIQPPINADGTSVLKQGRTIPAKFNLYDANGVPISTPGVVSSFFLTAILSGTVTTTVEDVVDTNNPDTAFRWDGQEWIFNITTGNLSGGSTYIYTITLNDGSTIVFEYGLR